MARADKYERRHIADMAAYERMIEEIYRQAAREAAYIAQTVPDFNPDALFSFKDYPITRQRVNELLEKLHSGVETTVVNGIKAEWTLANNKNSELSRRVFGDSIGKLTQEQYRRYFSTNGGALDAFLKRKEAGLNLSDRVWNYTNGFKGEIELGIDIGLRNGLSADEMSRELRSYLKHPDMLFRRVRDEHGQLVLSKRAAAFHPGQGVYRSSYMNARRLAATETNMAYRTADHLRHQQLDFVVGIEIRLSNNHNCKGVPAGQFFDICDELQGRYPKDFKFTGWHPHCRCHVETILKTEDELMAENEAILKGEEPSQDSVNRVYAMPKAFTDWLANNEERIERARSLPYFLRDNGSMKDGVYRLNKFGASSVQSAVDGVFRRATLEELKQAGITIYGERNFAGSFGEEVDFDYIGVKAGLESIAGSNGFKIDRFVVKSRDDSFEFVAEGKGFSLARGFIRRPNGEIECHHTYFELAEELQGKGISKDVFRTFYPEYKRMGVDYLTVYANINVGGYTWSKYGFYAEDMSNALHAARRSSEAQAIVHEFYAKLQDKNTPFPMHLIADLPDGKEILKGTSWYGILDFRNPEQVSIFERYLGLGKKDNRMAMNNTEIAGELKMTSRMKKEVSDGVRQIADKGGLFGKSFSINFTPHSDGTLMTWHGGTLTVSTTRHKMPDGTMYCPASELRSAIRKLRNGNPLTFNEEYTIECLFHENVHSKAYGVLRQEAGSLNEIIQEVCTQLYAREKYTSILDAYGVESANHELIRYGGYGYRRQCDILRGIFTKDGVLQLGELKGIANQNVEGLELLKILCEKRGYDFKKICDLLETMISK